MGSRDSRGSIPSLTYDDCMNVVSDRVSNGLEEGKDSRSNALELVRLLDTQEVSIKEENNMVEAEAPRVVVEGEQDDFPELPLLRGDCVLTSSNIGIGAEVEYMSRMFDDGRDCDGSDNSFLVSLRFDVDGPLVDVDGPLVDVGGDLPKQRDGFFCPPLPWECAVASVVPNGISTEGRQEGSSNKLNFDSSSGDVTNLGDKSKDNDRLFGIQNDMGLPLHSSRKLKDTCKVINFSSSSKTDTRHKKTEEEVLGTPYIDNEASCSAEGSTGEPTDCSGVERSTTEKLSSAEFDTKGSTFDSFKRTSTCCSIDNDNCTGDKILPRVIANSSSLTSVRRTNPKRAASLRSNLADEKSHSLIRIHSNQRKYRSKFGASTSCTPMTLKMFSGVNRKIRSLQRKARLSVWGTVESLCTIIKQWDELMMHDSLPTAAMRSKSKKARRFFNRRKITAALKNKESRLFSTKIPHQSIPPSMLVAQPSLENGIENVMPTSDCHIGTSSTKVELEWNFAEKWYAVVRPNIREVQEEKDLESTLTQETSSDNIISECHGVSSQVDPEFVTETIDDEHPSDPGNSPDSDVYNPITDVGSLTFEGSPITKRRFTLNKNFQIQESKEESCLTSVAPNFMKPIVAHLPFLTRQIHACEDQKSGHREKKKCKQKNERKGKTKKRGDKSKREKMLKKAAICECSFLISDPSSGEGKLESKAKSNEVRIASLSSSCCPNCQEGDRGGKCSIVSRGQCEIGSNTERLLIDSSVSGSVDLNKFTQNRTVINNPLQNDCNEQLEEILSSCHVKECQVCESGKEGLCKNKSNCADSTSHTRTFIYGHQKENILSFNNLREADGFPNGNDNLDFSLGTTNNVSLLGGETVAIDTLLKDETNDVATPVFSESTREPCISGHSFSGKKAWALCDDCEKWRCVPDELVHDIEKGRWTCKDNVDEAFADCSIPQEKTDEDINIDLGISDEQCFSTTQHNYGELAPLRQSAATRTTWIPIKSNLFLHRNRRSQTIDEIMVCHCKPPLDGGLGCGEECLNRMLNIECVKGTCPCGNLCSNQQFQKRKYAKFKWLKCGKKGYGLQLEHNASSGQFLIEYVGEVLDLAAYEARLRYYASRGQKHFYFMTLNGGEVIDACEKGNLGRFINHSCDPNCRTEKWMVNGEVCIGLFAIRDIKKGEEITFDYNYVRVFGAAAKKCVCGSADCRGYIGGDPSNSEVIVQDDSDTEDPEPVMIEDGEIEPSVMGIDSVATGAMVAGNPSMPENGARFENHRSENEDAIQQLISEHLLLDNQMQPSCVESESNMCRLSNINPLQDVKLGLSSKEPDHAFYEDINAGTQLTSVYRSLPHEQLSDGPQNTLKTLQQTDCGVHAPDLDDAINFSSQNSCRFMHNSSATCLTEEILTASKHNSVVKTSRHVKVKRSRVSIKSVASGKTKKVSTAISNRHIEGVEEKLNELLDEDGGIYRKKDAAKGYLKLLVVTAAAGDEIKGSMSQSARDLSLILDAILKTKSRMVLVDIINKNGLQMLHNIMKQNRDNFNRIPILRKLLKVLEFLAEKEILTIDHIHAPPPRCGMESFKESMLKLMKHRDTQVHLIARNFADQWLPRNFRRVEPSDRDGKQFCSDHSRSSWCQTSSLNSWDDHDKINAANHQPSPQVDIHGETLPLPTPAASSSASFTNINPTAMAKPRKRKSRWDQPSDANEQASEYSADQLMMCSSSCVKLLKPSQLEPISDIEVPDKKSEGNYASNAVICDDDEDDELPPGFGSPRKDEFCQMASESSDITGDAVVVGHPQERYLAHLTVAYGMPISLMQHQVTDSANLFDPSSKIAPAMPFKPFPPLPAYPRQGPCLSNPTSRSFNGNPNYRHPKQQAGFPKYGNGRRFFHPPQWNSRQQPRRF